MAYSQKMLFHRIRGLLKQHCFDTEPVYVSINLSIYWTLSI